MILNVEFDNTEMDLSVKFDNAEIDLDVKFSDDDIEFDNVNIDFEAKFSNDKIEIDVDFGEVTRVKEYIGGDLYQGNYEVTPTVKGQTLPTKDRVLIEDIRILEIPVYNVSNTAGGNTIYIAREI